MTEKARENKARRELAKQGYALQKSHGIISGDNYGGYRIVDIQFNRIEAGERFNLGIEDVENWINE